METAEQANARLDEQLAIYRELEARLGAAGKLLTTRLDYLRCADVCAEGNRILALAAWLCVEAEQPGLFEKFYSGVLFGNAPQMSASEFARSVYATPREPS